MSHPHYYAVRRYIGADIAETEMNNMAKNGWRVHTIIKPSAGDRITVFYEHPDSRMEQSCCCMGNQD